MHTSKLHRREFLRQGAVGTLGTCLLAGMAPALNVLGANARLRLGVMGLNGRGSHLTRTLVGLPDAQVAYLCDVDEHALAKGVAAAKGEQPPPRTVKDFRHILDDPHIDGLVIAAPDHWHGPATILACAAGKHVYVEKPACHNPREGEWMIEAARRYRRVVQVGTQRRSMPQFIEGIQRVHSGEIGRVFFSRGWYANHRGSIGRGHAVPVPAWLDWELWQGPAPERPYHNNVVPYKWHWFWLWGTGELGNNGVHALDLCRWGLDVDYAHRVTAGGGRYFYHDDQQTPDTLVTTYDFGDKVITWEGRSCQARGIEGTDFGAAFYGEKGTMVMDGSSYRIYSPSNKLVAHVRGSGSEAPHLENFLECVRNGHRPNADVEIGYKGTLLCLLGNIAWRVHQELECDPTNGHIQHDSAAEELWGREYRPGWKPQV